MIEKMKNTQGPLQRTRAIKIVLFCHGQGVSWSYETGDSAECSETFQQAVPSSRGPVTRPLASPSGKLKKSAHSSSNFKIFKWQTATPTIFIFRTLFEPFGQPFHSQKRVQRFGLPVCRCSHSIPQEPNQLRRGGAAEAGCRQGERLGTHRRSRGGAREQAVRRGVRPGQNAPGLLGPEGLMFASKRVALSSQLVCWDECGIRGIRRIR